jgi:hypothetical protein
MTGAREGHRRIDARSLALHRAIAGKLRADPSLLVIAHDHLDRWSKERGRSQPYWDAWRGSRDARLQASSGTITTPLHFRHQPAA